MSKTTPRKVCVLGAGIIGICSALWLQREGLDVTILDPNPPGSGSSYGNAGGFSAASVVPMSMPGVLQNVPGYLTDSHSPLVIRWSYLPKLAPWLWRFVQSGKRERVEEQAKALRELLGPVFDCLAPLVKQAEAEHLIRREGMLYVYRSEQSLKGDELGWDLRRRNGVVFERLSGRQITEFDPSLSSDFQEAILVPGNGHTIDPQDLVRHLARAAQRAGAQTVTAHARGFELADGKLTGIRVDGGIIPADAAVVACGAYSKQLTDSLGEHIPLDTERGYHVLLKTPEATPRLPVLDAERKFVATPMRAGLRIAGIVEFAGLKRPPDMRITSRLMEDARAMFPALREDYPNSEVDKWMGFRPSMPDSLPVIGRARLCQNIVYAFGHGHVGMCGGPMTGKLVAELLVNRPSSIDLAPFSPSRF